MSGLIAVAGSQVAAVLAIAGFALAVAVVAVGWSRCLIRTGSATGG
jgi:hypothetical protein